MRLMFAVLIAAAAATPATAARNTEQLLSGHATGPAVNCIRSRDIRDQTIVNDSVVLFKVGSKLYRNDIAPACGSLSPNRSIITKSFSGDMCRGDIFQLFDSGSRTPWGSCTFGSFTPWELDKAPAK